MRMCFMYLFWVWSKFAFIAAPKAELFPKLRDGAPGNADTLLLKQERDLLVTEWVFMVLSHDRTADECVDAVCIERIPILRLCHGGGEHAPQRDRAMRALYEFPFDGSADGGRVYRQLCG